MFFVSTVRLTTRWTSCVAAGDIEPELVETRGVGSLGQRLVPVVEDLRARLGGYALDVAADVGGECFPGQVVAEQGFTEPPGVECFAGVPGGDGHDQCGQAVGLEPVCGRHGQAEPVEDPLKPLEPELGVSALGQKRLRERLRQGVEPGGSEGETLRPGGAARVEGQVEGFVRAVSEVVEDLLQKGSALLAGHVGEFDLEQRVRVARPQDPFIALAVVEPRGLRLRQLTALAGLLEPAPDSQPDVRLLDQALEQVEARRQPVEVSTRPGGVVRPFGGFHGQDQFLDAPAKCLVDRVGADREVEHERRERPRELSR